MQKKLITIPIEIYKREFYFQLYLALLAANEDYQVLLGQQSEKLFKSTKNGIYFHKDHANWSVDWYKMASRRKMKTVAFDIEGLIYHTAEIYLNNRASKWILENIDLVLLWGNSQKKLISKVSNNNSNQTIIGSPKFDICNLLRDSVVTNTNRKANRILINTRFASTNIKNSKNYFDNLIKLGVLKTQKDIVEHKYFIESENKIYEEFLNLIKLLDNNSNFKITIRPHPAEDHSFYTKLSSKFNNVVVDSKTDLYQQILNHDCVIHDGCTTAIEANCIGRPVFGLRPENLKNAYNNFANNFSLNFSCHKDLFDYLIKTKICDYIDSNCDNLAKSYIHNWKSSTINTTNSILESFNKFDIKYQNILNPSILDKFNYKIFLFKLISKTSYFNVFLKIKRVNSFITSRQMIESKFPNLDSIELKNLIENLNTLDKNTVKYDDLVIKTISKKLILIYKK